MPLRKTKAGWFWGSKGPFLDKAKALQVARAAYASGYRGENKFSQNTIELQEKLGAKTHAENKVE